MDKPKLEAVPRTPLPRLWLLAIVPLAAIAWAGLAAHMTPHQNPLQQKLDALRGDGSADAPVGLSPRMSDVMIVKNDLVRSIGRRQPARLSPAQDRLLTDCLKGPVDERSQSEALDVLSLAQRVGALSPAQVHNAVEECLTLLSRTPPYMVRLEGARFLSHSKTPRGIPALRLLGNDPVPKIRAAAKQGLAEISQTAPP